MRTVAIGQPTTLEDDAFKHWVIHALRDIEEASSQPDNKLVLDALTTPMSFSPSVLYASACGDGD